MFNPVVKAWVKGSTWIPIFDVDDKFDAGTLSRKVTNFVMGNIIPFILYFMNCVNFQISIILLHFIMIFKVA